MSMKLRLAANAILLVLVLTFAVQNVQVVELKFLAWQIELPRGLLIVLVLLIGIVVGWFTHAMWRLSRRKH